MITENEALAYEAGRSSFVMTQVYIWFPKYFVWVTERKYKKYKYFCDILHKERHKELLNHYTKKPY